VPNQVVALAATLAAAAGLAVPAATASSNMKVGIYDEGATFFDDQAKVFGAYRSLGTQVLRVNLYWGGKLGVAKYRPFDGSDPRDAGYNWALYDRVVQYAGAYKLKVLFSITGTPRWANGGQSSNRPPKNFQDLYKFAYAAAARYSGSYTGTDGRTLPAVRLWAAWNEPNNPVFLRPQFVKAGGRWVIQSAKDYAKICNAIYGGVHATMYKDEKVACGVTAMGLPPSYYEDLARDYEERRAEFLAGMKGSGFDVEVPEGAYYALAGIGPLRERLGLDDDTAFCRELVLRAGVAAVPGSSFFIDPARGRGLIRFAFPKRLETIREATGRLAEFGRRVLG